ncbi:putative nucleocapsid, Phlebovirus/Tenuivirus [Helianthus annuus]|uniref:Nucleocapsid, Phlebovirus/Tenuivirus n=2 Tax=Helianthus annuus TaxID=4232 RepID=A0A9K3NAK9_HELAN|nr:putative nucleocapsid, Phlebovirus/Tenuivirus [Helianthus annuus]KAJ0527683.1 putative nucleocapsid, Phlebovirus/Tenuivirus [Helianthus annuus]KAJ0536450.1 putative nucleocapsid, Phlebovirus/Tenuivirus [Helianthus annuus]KAJ0544092.1 putative nucleocapsid, Phlebovirus/Tenuivirus [Helianthus annuus]KAJ0713010.1 putative nucleocapsid, Phlebovirus/Tenuivirus [Helianthus annuus]
MFLILLKWMMLSSKMMNLNHVLLESFAPPEIDTSDLFNFVKLSLATMNHEFNELDLGINNEDEFESLLAFLAPIENDKCSYVDLNFDGILKHIFNCSILHNWIGADTVRDINEMVMFGLCRGDIRKDQLRKTVGGDERIVELAYMYKIPLRSAAGERIRLQSDTLTFVRAVTCFPHVASLFLFKAVEFAMDGAKSVLASEQLPGAMKHSGFCGLIPKCCDPYLMKAYSFAHTAYMVDFGKMINPGDKRSLKSIALRQLDYSKSGIEKLPYSDEFKVGTLRAVGLTDPGVFKKIVDVCNNLCKVVGEPALTFATAEKNHIKNGMICFFEDDSKDVAAGEQGKKSADKLRVTSILNV